MARTDRILAIDIGATSIKVGEFEYPSRDTRTLVNFAHREYEEELTESTRSVVVAGLLRQMLVESNFQARRALVSMSGQSAFTRFVRLPPFAEDEKRVRQIVEFEAKQNVPFNMDEVIWDYQLIANPEEAEMDVMFVVIKNEIVEQMTGAVQAVGLEPLLVDVAPAACYNAARANRVGDDECSMILNIGGRSTSLLFADGPRFFARIIPIAGHSITQQVAKEFGIGFAEAEELKRRHGFVALGGAYAEPESEVAAAVSKIIRNVMARLHGEINRSISVYRAQQRGNRPTRLYLTGGSSTMTYCDHFFSEKLHMEVEYFNPFQVVGLGPAVDRARLQEVAHMFSEVIGLGLRYRLPCPIEVTMVPEVIRRQQALKRKKPFVFASLACVLVILLVAWFGVLNRANLYARSLAEVKRQREGVESYFNRIQQYTSDTEQRLDQFEAVTELLKERRRWPDIYNELYRLKPVNLWFYSIEPILGEVPALGGMATEGGGGMFGGGGGEGIPGGEPGMEGEMGMPGGEMGMPGGEMGMPGEGGGGFPGEAGEAGMTGGGFGAPGGGGMGGMSGMGAAAYEPVDISGLTISGHGVILGTSDVSEAIQAAVTGMRNNNDDQENGAEEEAAPANDQNETDENAEGEQTDGDGEQADAQDEEGGGLGPLGGEEEDEEELDPEVRRQQAIERARKQATPELAFLELLKASDFVDSDVTYTGIRSYAPPQSVDNLSSFTIQVKFKEPFTYNHLGQGGGQTQAGF